MFPSRRQGEARGSVAVCAVCGPGWMPKAKGMAGVLLSLSERPSPEDRDCEGERCVQEAEGLGYRGHWFDCGLVFEGQC